MYLAQNIKWVRLLKGMKQADFAKLIGTNPDKLYTYESGMTKPNEVLINKVAKIAGITPDDLINKDLRIFDINVKNPDTKKVEYILTHKEKEENNADLEKRLKEKDERIEELKELVETLKLLMRKDSEKS